MGSVGIKSKHISFIHLVYKTNDEDYTDRLYSGLVYNVLTLELYM